MRQGAELDRRIAPLLDRIAAHDGKLNSFIRVTEDIALAEAEDEMAGLPAMSMSRTIGALSCAMRALGGTTRPSTSPAGFPARGSARWKSVLSEKSKGCPENKGLSIFSELFD